MSSDLLQPYRGTRYALRLHLCLSLTTIVN
nr:MAG TPA: hypothetical protein [Caudoviricetes sp.]